MKKKRDFSLNEIKSGRYYNYNGTWKWKRLYTKTRRKELEKLKSWLLDTCKYNSQVYRAINRMTIHNLPGSYGIFNRLTTAEYIAGQDYPGELRFVKNLIKKEC